MKHGTPSDRISRREAGFTLIEALTAIVILSFGLMAVTNLLIVAASSNAVANQSTAATNSASQVLEQLRSVSFQNLAIGGEPYHRPGGHGRVQRAARHAHPYVQLQRRHPGRGPHPHALDDRGHEPPEHAGPIHHRPLRRDGTPHRGARPGAVHDHPHLHQPPHRLLREST